VRRNPLLVAQVAIDTRNDDSPAFLFLFASGSAQLQNFFAGLREVQFSEFVISG
jgi:hypothetical protein